MDLLNILSQEGLLSLSDKQRVVELATRWNVPAHELARTMRLVPMDVYGRAYFRAYGFHEAKVGDLEWDSSLASKIKWEDWCMALALPLRGRDGKTHVVAVDPVNLPEGFRQLADCTEWISEKEWVEGIRRFRGPELLDEAVNGLWRRTPDSSAKKTFSVPQLVWMWSGGSLILAGMAWSPALTFLVLNSVINIFYFLCVSFKTALVLIGASQNTSRKVNLTDLSALKDSELPIYTVLVPVYKEPRVIPHLVHHLSELDYPLSRLDVKVLLEEDDPATLEAFRASRPPPNFHAVVVPTAQPKTKPKACNYGLQLARGEYLTIYDAEDLPEPDQLKKVVAAFARLPPSACCIQAALNYFNWRENTLTRMFTLEYSNWFDYNLPGMEALKVPIPLGGTSNHFRVDRLRELGAWDPFNVTEDADLGVRATARGMTISTIDSTTYEEANRAYGNWIRQRSRWIKGYMQTWLVNMRQPIQLIRTIGWKAFLGFMLFIGGTPFIFLANPLSWGIFLLWLGTNADFFKEWFPSWLLFLSFFNLLIGNFLGVYVCILGVFKRKNYPMVIHALLNPLYWMLHAVASYKALWQLLVKPSYWEKTDHGLTTMEAVMPSSKPRK